MKLRTIFCMIALSTLFSFAYIVSIKACTRAVYLGEGGMIVTGRTMDWKEDPQSNIYLFPRGLQKRAALPGNKNTVTWTSKYGSVSTAGYDIGICDGMNEKGLVANLLFLTESSYYRPDDNRPVMGISIWTQYVLDNFATVEEAVAGLKDDTFRIDAPDLPNGAKSTLHLSVSDATGNSAIFEYIQGRLIVHEGKDCQVMTNSPTYDKQMTLNDYDEYDYLIGMDTENIRNMQRISGGDPDEKIYKLLTFTGSGMDVADPWYTGDFEATYRDVKAGCEGLLSVLREELA